MRKDSTFVAGILAAALALATATEALAFEFVQYDFSDPANRWMSNTATGGKDLEITLVGNFGTVASFSTQNIGGTPTEAMFVPDAAATGDYCRYIHNFPANGGGADVNQYTFVADMMWPASANNSWRAIFTAYNGPVAYVSDTNELSVYYADTDHRGGTIAPDTWYRIVVAVDLTKDVDSVVVYLDGARVASGDVTGGLDNRDFSSPYAMYHYSGAAGELGDVHISCVQICDYTMMAVEAAAFGGPTAAGPPAPTPTKMLAVDASQAPFTAQAQGFTFTDDLTVIVTNDGVSDTLNVTPSLAGADVGECTLNPNTAQALPPGASVDLLITWTPGGAAGQRDVQLSLAHDDPYSASPVLIPIGGQIAPNIATDLVCHLKLDGDLTDSSGRSHNATAVGTYTHVAGQIGQGANLPADGASYLTLGTFAAGQDLFFDTGQDFTISMWIRNIGGLSAWPVFFSNKDWDSGGNVGYLLGTYGTDPRPYVNLGGPRHDIYAAGTNEFTDANWHHFCVVFDRDADLKLFFDGVLGATVDISANTNVEPGLPVNINNDGANKYAAQAVFEYDDVGVWRRALPDGDAIGIYNFGQKGLDLTNVGPEPALVAAVNNLPPYLWKRDAVPTTITVAVSNSGLAPLSVGNFQLTSTHASEYALVDPGTAQVNPGKTLNVAVVWTPNPNVYGYRTTSISFTHNDTNVASPRTLDLNSSMWNDSVLDLVFERFGGVTLEPAVWEVDGAADAGIGFTHTPPLGWSVEVDPATDVGGVPEWYGWCFSIMSFWNGVAGQTRNQFTRAYGIFAIADGDEHDDTSPAGVEYYLDTTLHSPVVTVPAGEYFYISWDNDYRAYGSQRGYFWISYDDGTSQTLEVFSSDSRNQEVVYFFEPLAADTNVQFHWRYTAHNDWWWALDSVRIMATAPTLSARNHWSLYE